MAGTAAGGMHGVTFRHMSGAGVSETEVGAVAGVPEALLDELTEVLIDKIDVLLDRVTDRALAAPTAGSQAWRSQWLERGSDQGREQLARRLYVRAVLAHRAGVGLCGQGAPTTPPNPPTSETRLRRPRRRPRVDAAQLSMFDA